MQLPTRVYGQVVEALQKAAENSGSDKRRLSRMEIQTKVNVGVILNGQLRAKLTALTRDLSIGGIGRFISTPVERGHLILVELPRLQHDRTLVICTAMFEHVIAN